MCWSLSAPIVGAVRGEDDVRSTLFGHQMTYFSATFVVAGSSDTTRFGSLEFPMLPPVRMWVPPIFEPSQTFLFGSLDFVADQLGVLCFHEEAMEGFSDAFDHPHKLIVCRGRDRALCHKVVSGHHGIMETKRKRHRGTPCRVVRRVGEAAQVLPGRLVSVQKVTNM